MTRAEYAEWIAYYAIEPFGNRRADLRAAMIAAASQAPHVKGAPRIDDFILFSDDRFTSPEDEEEAFFRMLERAAKASGE